MKLLKIKKVGSSWDIRLTPDFVRANSLRDGDYVVLDTARLRVLRREDLGMIGRELVLDTTK